MTPAPGDETTMNRTDQTNARRACGWDEDAALLYVDGDFAPLERSRFDAHLGDCAACRRDVEAFGALYRALADMAVPEASPELDRAILAAVPLRPASVAGAPGAARTGWRRVIGPRPILAGALISLTLAVLWVVSGWVFGSWVLQQTPEPLAHFGVRASLDGVSRVLAAVKVSETLIAVARTLEPIWRSAVVVGRSVQTEFWLISLLLALMTFWGAVRLAVGRPVLERGVRRVHFAF